MSVCFTLQNPIWSIVWRLELIAERLGHEKVETTLNTYSHLYPSTQSKLAGLLDKKHEEEEE